MQAAGRLVLLRSSDKKSKREKKTMAEPTSNVPPVVNVRTNGHVEDVPYVGGMTVQAAVQATRIKTGWTTKYFVNGTSVRSSHILQAGDKVTLAPRAKNGL